MRKASTISIESTFTEELLHIRGLLSDAITSDVLDVGVSDIAAAFASWHRAQVEDAVRNIVVDSVYGKDFEAVVWAAFVDSLLECGVLHVDPFCAGE